MIKELELRKSYLEGPVETIYFGGGTPSMLAVREIQSIIDAVYERFQVDPYVEITMEANPENLTEGYLDELRDSEVNRLSIGIQSFDDASLKWMNRAHEGKEARKSLELAKKYGFDRINADLIFGIPHAGDELFGSDLDELMGLEIDHISCYALTVEEGTALHHFISKGRSQAPKDNETTRQFYIAHDRLSEGGYLHYETSNYSKPGCESRHNSSYWNGKKYLGIGPGAHSYDKESRSWNVSHMTKYLEGVKEGKLDITTERLSEIDRYNEYVMTAIRRKDGIDKARIFGDFEKMSDHFLKSLEEVSRVYIEENEERVWLSREGLVFADFVGSMLFKV